VAGGPPVWELPGGCVAAIVGFSPDGRWLVTATDHEYRLWRVGSWRPGPVIPSENRINGDFTFASDGRMLAIDRGGRAVLVDPDSGREFAALEPSPEAPRGVDRLALSPDGGRLGARADNEVLVWDLRLVRSQLAEMGLDWDAPPIPAIGPAEAAAPPLRVRVEGTDWLGPASQGSMLAREGRWDEASAAYARAMAHGADEPEVWHRDLILRLRAGDSAGYRAGCAALLDRSGRDERPGMVNTRAWACAIGPDAPADWPALVRSVDRAVARRPEDVALRNTSGAVLLRAGRPEESVGALEESIRLNGHGGNAFDWLFLAMARHKLGRSEAAKAALETARDWIAHGDERALPDPYIMSPLSWSTRLELEVLAREATSVLTGPTTTLPADASAR
jgi:tetratricopeptide (TPR) repeat protein